MGCEEGEEEEERLGEKMKGKRKGRKEEQRGDGREESNRTQLCRMGTCPPGSGLFLGKLSGAVAPVASQISNPRARQTAMPRTQNMACVPGSL
jgi:hypothetical protein